MIKGRGKGSRNQGALPTWCIAREHDQRPQGCAHDCGLLKSEDVEGERPESRVNTQVFLGSGCATSSFKTWKVPGELGWAGHLSLPQCPVW